MRENWMKRTLLLARPQNCSPIGAATHRLQVLIAAQRSDGEAALREAQLEPDPGFRRFELAVAHYVRGDRAAADAALADLIANGGREGFAYQIAEVYALRGEKDKAFEWLQIALDDRDAGMLGLSADPLLRGLRDDARYKAMLAEGWFASFVMIVSYFTI